MARRDAAGKPAPGGAKPAAGEGKTIRILQVRSGIGFPEKQKRVLAGLGLRRPGRSVVLEDTPSIRGMVAKIPHLVRIEETE